MAVFFCVVWYKFTDVSDVLSDLISSMIALMKGAASISETSVTFYRAICCHNPEDSRLHTRYGNLKFIYVVA
jgi:hypothetical protein